MARRRGVEDLVGFVGSDGHYFLGLVVQGFLVVEGDGAEVFDELGWECVSGLSGLVLENQE